MYPTNRDVIIHQSSPLAALLAMAKKLSASTPIPGKKPEMTTTNWPIAAMLWL